nr:hypothetical protein [Tanacetum cinerariifolium]
MPSEYQQDYKKTRAYAPKIYNDPNMFEQLRDIYKTLENRRMAYFKDRKDKILPYGMILTRLFRNLKANMFEHPCDECYVLIPRKMAPLKAKQPKHPPLKRTRNLGKSERTQLPTSSSSDSPPSDNEDLPSTKLSLRSYYRALPICANMSKEQRETRGMFKNLAR